MFEGLPKLGNTIDIPATKYNLFYNLFFIICFIITQVLWLNYEMNDSPIYLQPFWFHVFKLKQKRNEMINPIGKYITWNMKQKGQILFRFQNLTVILKCSWVNSPYLSSLRIFEKLLCCSCKLVWEKNEIIFKSIFLISQE